MRFFVVAVFLLSALGLSATEPAPRPKTFTINQGSKGSWVVTVADDTRKNTETTDTPEGNVDPATVADIKTSQDLPYEVLSPTWEAEEVSLTGLPMDDGFSFPAAPAMLGVFTANGKMTVMCNHRQGVKLEDLLEGCAVPSPDVIFNQGSTENGAVTRTVIDTASWQVERQELVLAGTQRNTASAVTPWGSFLTSEQPESKEANESSKYGKIFELQPQGRGLSAPVALPIPGNWSIGALAVDEKAKAIYIGTTGSKNNDNDKVKDNGLLLRFVPSVWGNLSLGGRLSVLSAAPTSNIADISLGQRFSAWWVDIPSDNTAETPMAYASRVGAPVGNITGLAVRPGELIFNISDSRTLEGGKMFLLKGDSVMLYPAQKGAEGPVQPGAMGVGFGREQALWVAEERNENSRLLLQKPDGTWEPVLWVREGAIGGVAIDSEGQYVFVTLAGEGSLLVLKRR